MFLFLCRLFLLKVVRNKMVDLTLVRLLRKRFRFTVWIGITLFGIFFYSIYINSPRTLGPCFCHIVCHIFCIIGDLVFQKFNDIEFGIMSSIWSFLYGTPHLTSEKKETQWICLPLLLSSTFTAGVPKLFLIKDHFFIKFFVNFFHVVPNKIFSKVMARLS